MNISNKAKEYIAQSWAGSVMNELKIYSGPMPTDPEVATLPGTMLVSLMQQSGTNISGGVANFGEFAGTANATGTAGYAVFDGGVNSMGRIYFTLGLSGSGAEIIISGTSIVEGDYITGTATITAVP